jgi:cytochrome c oxidase assembly protein subunit 15
MNEDRSRVQGFQGSILQPVPRLASKWPYRIAVLTACATFPLLFIGGLVTAKGAGLAVPDWPTTFGYNMFLYPWSEMVGNIFYEHSHRLVASGVGLLTILLTITFWLKESRRWLRWLGVAALLLVVVQGVLGGLRVVLLEETLAIVHACLAQLFFALIVSLAVFTSAEWNEPLETKPLPDGGRLWRLCAATTGLIYLQVIFGAVLRHTGERLDAHLLFAALVAVHVILVLSRVLRFHAERPTLVRPAWWLASLLCFQLTLGVASYFGKFTALLRLPIDALVLLTTSHLALGAVMLVISLSLTLKAFRLASAASASPAQLLTEQYST